MKTTRTLLATALAIGTLMVGGAANAQIAQCYHDLGGDAVNFTTSCTWTLDGTAVTASGAELNAAAGVTCGAVAAGKVVCVDSNKDAGDFRNLDAVNIDAGASAVAGTVDVFPTTAASGKLSITAADSAGDTTTTIVNATQAAARTYTIPDAGAAAFFMMGTGAQTVEGVISRADLVQNDLQAYRIPLRMLHENDGTGLTLSGNSDTSTSADHYMTEVAGVWKLFGNSPNSTTETDTSIFQWQLPPEYVDGETVTFRISALYTADGDTKTVDAVVYEAAADGSVGSDLNATAAVTLTNISAFADFTITPTTLAAGDMLSVEITTVFEDSDGAVGEAQIDLIAFLLDVKG